MALEKKLLSIAPIAFTQDGTNFGVITLSDTTYIQDKQIVCLQSSTQSQASYQVKRVLSATQLIVGPPDNKLAPNNFSDISKFKISDGAFLFAVEQDKSALPTDKDHYIAIYEPSPINGDRVVFVDPHGRFYGPNNPLPISFDGTVNVGDVAVVDPVTKTPVKVNSDGSINVVIDGSGGGTTSKNAAVQYNETSLVPSGISTTILTFTASPGVYTSLQRIMFSGENTARYDIQINGVTVATYRTYFGGALDGSLEFNNEGIGALPLNVGDNVTVQVLHNRPGSATFEATVEYITNSISPTGYNFKAIYNEIFAIISNTPTTVATYTVGAGIVASTLQRIIVSGENIAKYDVLINSVKVATKRTYFGSDLNSIFEFEGIAGGGLGLVSGNVVTVQVTHYRPTMANFEATIQVIET